MEATDRGLRSGNPLGDPLVALEIDRERLRREGYGDKEISDHHEDMAIEFEDDDLYKSSLVLRGAMIRMDRHIDEYISTLDLEPKTLDMKRSNLKRFAKVFPYSEDVTKKSLVEWIEGDLVGKQKLSLGV